MFIDNSTTDNFPKTLEIRNTTGGMIWQIYHVNNWEEAKILSTNAARNVFLSRIVVDYYEIEETWPNWRETCDEPLKSVLT